MPASPASRRTWTKTTSAICAAFTVAAAGVAVVALCAALPAQAQPRKDTLVLAMTLEPNGLASSGSASSQQHSPWPSRSRRSAATP